jgi:hypothetical protein
MFMKKFRGFTSYIFAVVGLLVVAQIANAQSNSPYQLTWLTTNATTSTGSNYTLSAQISAQGAGASSGGAYALNPVAPSPYVITRPRAYLPLVRR